MLQATFETAFKTIKKLVEDFDGNKDYYLTPAYAEQAARHDFIDKFFIALGWDVNHETDKNPYEQEAHIESNVDAQGKRKRADYAFYVAPNFRDVVYYAEAKKPSVQIENADDYFQAIRYGYSSKTPLAILTNFEQLHILDCRYTPSIQTALDRSHKKFTYKDYLNEEKFAEIYYVFSREAVANGSIAKRALELPKARGGAVQLGLFKGGYKPIDEALLDELDDYRNDLAHAFKNGNPELDHWALTEIVQRVIDRLVFIRFLEDKLIEPEDIISNFGTKSESVWKDFVSTCRKLDKVYNGTIYKKHDILDAPDFKFDENVFADICEKLSSKNTPYDFDKIPIHILGSIYERFLGKIITTTAKRAKVEEKPEVKKAGGVFYTPEYIVRYIVENTIGKLIKGKNPDEISKMRFADIACGSGSFLLGAYDCLLRYHANYYNQNPKKATARDCVERDGALLLTLHKKREILLNNIYGVDIDQQAVEVSQLSLYLKLLEHETLGSTAASLRAEAGETVLPSLNKNIQCGNSLIEPDFYVGVQEEMALYENKKEEVREINSFDWRARFPEIMIHGGFDAVIGNPPYVRQEMLGEFKEYFQRKYKVFHGMADLYTYFFERGVNLLNENGLFSIIVANKWMRANYGEPLRQWLKGRAVYEIVDFGDLPVFQNATTYPCVIAISKKPARKQIDVCKVENLEFEDLAEYVRETKFSAAASSLKDDGWSLTDEKSGELLEKIQSKGIPLGEYIKGKIYYGIKTGLNEAFVIDEETKTRLIKEDKKSTPLIKPLLAGRDIKRYCSEKSGRYLIAIPKGWTRQNIKDENAWASFKRKFGSIARHLGPFEDSAKKRSDQGDYWWELRACDYYTEFDKIKIMVPDIALRGNFAYSDDGSYCLNTSYIIASDDKFLLGILNSKLITFFYRNLSSTYRGGYLRFIYQYLEQLPIFKSPSPTTLAEIVSLVTSLLSLHKQIPGARADFEKNRISRQIEAADRRIDELVYELYGLTAGEIKIVEERAATKQN